MTTSSFSPFNLPDRLRAKEDPGLIAADEEFFAALDASLDHTIAELTERLAVARKTPIKGGIEALERDEEIHRLTARMRALRRHGLDLCLGRMVDESGSVAYLGRLGLRDQAGRQLLIDWRTPVAEPFFAATHANPLGLVSRRRYHWTDGRITDYWDEVFATDELEHNAALDDQSAFIASLGGARSGRMRDVLATIQADQDAIIRAPGQGALVVDGGPGTGKTVVALHRTAYLLYNHPRIHHRGGVLFVGPSVPFLAYVADVLPSLGEDGVLTCTLRDLVPEGAAADAEADPEVARLKADARLVEAIEPAVALFEEPPAEGVWAETPWADVWISADDWAEAFASIETGTPHNEARGAIWDALAEIALDKIVAELTEGLEDEALEEEQSERDEFAPADQGPRQKPIDPEELRPGMVRAALARDSDLVEALGAAWPILDPAELLSDLWSVPAYLRRCAPWLGEEGVRRLARPEGAAWTLADLPLLDAARRRLGDPDAAGRDRRREVALAAERERMDEVVADLIRHDPTEMLVMSMLSGEDLRAALDERDIVEVIEPDRLGGPFAHVVVDEAQELTDAQWQMLRARCPSGSFTIVGDRAQARRGFTETWAERLERVGVGEVALSSLSINYRTPRSVMDEAAPVIRAAIPDANVPVSIREGAPVGHGAATDLERIVAEWQDAHPDGIGCVIGDPAYSGTERVRSLTPELAKGLEFDLVVLVDPERFGAGIEGAVDRYVAMTRTTGQLMILG
ncbi:MAG: RNA polymerase recycling motor ATPase HelR [Propionibacteriaceae bacterium]|nr:RNA polymerase recycling motor ATPase HelR [Propionibacteriaceae bacterium]